MRYAQRTVVPVSRSRAEIENLVMPDGKTAGEHLKPELKKIRESGEMPQSLLPDYSRR